MEKAIKLLKDPKIIFITSLVIVLLVVIFFKPGFNDKISFQIEDNCGKFVNLVSHTIEDESTCQSRCRSQCVSKDYGFSKAEFILKTKECNSCTCYCK